MILDITVRPWLTRYLDNSMHNSTHNSIYNPLGKQREFYESIDLTLEFEAPITIEMILEHLHIPSDDCGIVIYNHSKVSMEDVITDDGIIKIYPPILGG